ncbi:hypothetical protein FQR65_LT07314 [Abscondita terminalis]|nr:hypothetical protein FQR65_LT07314 [Abscondita terminalis]
MNKNIAVFAFVACLVAVAVALPPSSARKAPTCPVPDPPFGAYFPDPDDCRYFYLCSNGEAIHVMCAPGTIFNPALNACDYESDQSCIPASKH